MQPILMIVSVLALLMPTAHVFKSNAQAFGLQEGSASFGSRGKLSEVAEIEAYAKTLDRYFKSHPRSTRFYVDALPEGKADSSPGGKKDWYAVKSEAEMLDAERGYATRSIVVSAKDGEIVRVEIGEPMEHSRHQNDYYFRSDGALAKISSDYDSNIAGVHILRENFYDANGKLLRATTQCFNVMTTSRGSREKRASCRKAEMREELDDYKFSIYAKSTELPGYDILKRR